VAIRWLNCDESTRRPAVVTTRISHVSLLPTRFQPKIAILRHSLAGFLPHRKYSPRPQLHFVARFQARELGRPAWRQPGPMPTAPWRHRMSRAVVMCRGISCSEHFPGQLAVVRVPPPPSGVGATARHHRASPQCAELTARDITFSGLGRPAARKRAGSRSRGTYEARGATRIFRTDVGSSTRRHPVARR
jgi:hypothetical protein